MAEWFIIIALSFYMTMYAYLFAYGPVDFCDCLDDSISAVGNGRAPRGMIPWDKIHPPPTLPPRAADSNDSAFRCTCLVRDASAPD